jgi:hypothetical protein
MTSWLRRGGSNPTTEAAKEVNDQKSQSKKPEKISDSEDEVRSTTDESVAKDPEAKILVIAKQGKQYLIYDKDRKIEVVKHLPDECDEEIECGRGDSLIGTKNPTTLQDLINEANKPESTITARELVESKLCKKLNTPVFGGNKMIWRLEWVDAPSSSHYYTTELKKLCLFLGITDLVDLKERARNVQDDHPHVPQAHSAAIISEDIPKTTGDTYSTEAELFYERAEFIEKTGQVVIASEEVEGIEYYLVQYRDEVRILKETKDTKDYERCIAADEDDHHEEEFSPHSHVRKLEKYAEKGLDSFQESVKEARLARNDHPTLVHDIWLFRIHDRPLELRCYSWEVKNQLLEKLGVFDLDTLMTFLNPTSASQATERNSPSPPPQQSGRKGTGRTESPKVMESIEESTVTLYKPGDGSGKYRHIASNVGGFNGTLQENTECIVQNSDDDKFRIWTWAQVSEFNARDNTIAYVFDKKNKEDRCRSHREFHFPDKEGMKELLKQGNLLHTEYSIEVILTWRVKDPKKKDGYKYSNSVLLNITNEKKKKIVLDARKKRDYKYEGPSRCSITTFRSLVGSDIEANKQVIHKLQKDTEAGQGYYETLQKRLDGRAGSRDGSRSKSRDCTPSAADQLTGFQEENEKLQEKLAKANEELQQLRPAFHKALSQQAKV